MSFWKTGEAPPPPGDPTPEDEERVLEKLATKTVERGMTVPAILFLESIKPLNFIGSQAMVFFEPVIQTVFNFRDYETLRVALEKRDTVEKLITKIEAQDAVAYRREKAIRKYRNEQKKTWKWYQRYLGLFTPRVEYPDWVVNPPHLHPDEQLKMKTESVEETMKRLNRDDPKP